MIEIEFIINAKTVNQPGFFVYFLPFMEYSSLGHEKLISVSQAPPHIGAFAAAKLLVTCFVFRIDNKIL